MSEVHWAVFALKDLQIALDTNRYDVASHHIEDAIAAILARDDQDNENAAPSVQAHEQSSAN